MDVGGSWLPKAKSYPPLLNEAERELLTREIVALSSAASSSRSKDGRNRTIYICDESATMKLHSASEGSQLANWVKENLEIRALFQLDSSWTKEGWQLWQPDKGCFLDVEQMLSVAADMNLVAPADDNSMSAFFKAHGFLMSALRARQIFCTGNAKFIDVLQNEVDKKTLAYVVKCWGGGSALHKVHYVADDINSPMLVKF